MRRCKLIALATVLVAALAAAAGPALSLERWRPAPVDFELAPGGDRISPPVRTPKRFNLVGMRWRGSAEPRIQIRARRDGRDWTPWTPLAAHNEDAPDPGRGEPQPTGTSAPSWVGEADWVQYRLSEAVPGLRLHFVNVKGTATAADRARTAIRGAVNTAMVSLAGKGGLAQAAGPMPGIVSREAWGASGCTPRSSPEEGAVRAAFIHHTVSANDYSRAEAPSVVLGICRYHRNSNGWNDIGYNFLVDKYGVLYEGRAGGTDAPIVGAQAQGYNAQSTGIANLGTFTSVGETQAALDAMARLIRWKLPIHGAPTAGTTLLTSAGGSTNRFGSGARVRVNRVAGHRDTNSTECPGNALYAQMGELRALVGDVRPDGMGTRVSARLSSRRVGYRRRVRMRGRLTNVDGGRLGGRTVEIQARSRGAFKTVARDTTDDEGIYSAPLRPRGNRTLRARFRGGHGLLSSASKRLGLSVRPVFTLRGLPSAASKGERITLEGSVSPRKPRLLLVIQRKRAAGFKTVSARRFRVRRGRFTVSFTPGAKGTLRVYLVANRDRSTIRGSTRRRLLRVG